MPEFGYYEEPNGQHARFVLPAKCVACPYLEDYCTGSRSGICPKWLPLLKKRLAELPLLQSEVIDA